MHRFFVFDGYAATGLAGSQSRVGRTSTARLQGLSLRLAQIVQFWL
ncbi:MAG: hypothetical protein ACLPUG_03175 [Acidimicrobiales bacterium]